MGFLSSVSSLVGQPGIQAIGAGLLSGALGGTALVASGALPLGGEAVTTPTVQLLACPDAGPPLATISDGSQLLVTGRNADGTWYEVYVGQPGIDRAWAPASSLTLQSAADALPVVDCAAPVPGPISTPAATVAATVESPTLAPPPTEPPPPTATPTAGPTATPRRTIAPPPTKKPTAAPTRTPSPTATKTATPTPTPFVDSEPPQISNLKITSPDGVNGQFYIYFQDATSCSPSSATITVQVTDNDEVDIVDLYYLPSGHGVTQLHMTHTSGNTWMTTITTQNGWNVSTGPDDESGRIEYWVVSYDASNNESEVVENSSSYRLYVGTCLL